MVTLVKTDSYFKMKKYICNNIDICNQCNNLLSSRDLFQVLRFTKRQIQG